ncbi:S4 domain-containing protein [Geoglobus sp.]
MRIDRWLHIHGYFESRSRAKLAVRRGLVLVNGKSVKPSYDVKDSDEITVLADDRPAGYYKLMELDTEWKLFTGSEVVLDLGSSAGGFLTYASERASLVIGIEYSREFEIVLRKIESERENVRVYIEDAFTFDTSALPELDIILCDITVDPEHSMNALLRFVPKLKAGGRVLFVSKDHRVEVPGIFRVVGEKKAEGKREWYLLLRVEHRSMNQQECRERKF